MGTGQAAEEANRASRGRFRWTRSLIRVWGSVRMLDELDENATSPEGRVIVALGMNEADVVPCPTLAYATRGETHAPLSKPGDGGFQVVHPQAYMIERRRLNAGPPFRIDRRHQIDLDAGLAVTARENVLIDVLFGAPVRSHLGEAKEIAPQVRHCVLVGAAYRDLLHSEDSERSL